jgi:tetratricopeptide (TPR) repeat protein
MMKPVNRCILLSAIFSLALFQAARSQQHEHQHGTVNFKTSCQPTANQRFTTGLALLHHMMYEQAAAEFTAAAKADPQCPMAQWGTAMSIIHPLWGERPTDAELKRGQAALAAARNLSASKHEAAYITATEAFFRNWETTSYGDQLLALEAALKKLHMAYPEDVDAAAFYALGQLATAPKTDKTFAHQRSAGAMLEQLHQKEPNHPGLFHYIIHAYDNPVLADKALAVARAYDKIAPDVPHALHMPSHIFVRLGHWPDAINWNIRSAASALRQPAGNTTSMHYAHAQDYLIYGYLQQGQDKKALEAVEKLRAVTNFQPTFATAYGIAAGPARYSLERGNWKEAAALPLRPHGTFPWEKYPAAESITYFARGIGSARSGDPSGAREAVAELNKLHDQMVQAKESYWSVLADAQRKSIEAWLALSAGDKEKAARLMEEAADREESVDKHPVTPGAVLPALELLGDMLLQLNKPEKAMMAYEASLKGSPNRLNSLYGAARTAELTGSRQKASGYYAKVVALAAGADTQRASLIHAKKFVAKK